MNKSVGLRRGTVVLCDYDPRWVEEFETEKEWILATGGEHIIAIEHIGSTAVSGLSAKPIIDMSAGIARFRDASALIDPLAAIGYHFYKKFQRQMLFAKGPDERRTHYLHVMRYRGAKWQNDLLFRDYLRAHPDAVVKYSQLKKKLAQKFPADREKYTDGKNDFITGVIQKAQQEKI